MKRLKWWEDPDQRVLVLGTDFIKRGDVGIDGEPVKSAWVGLPRGRLGSWNIYRRTTVAKKPKILVEALDMTVLDMVKLVSRRKGHDTMIMTVNTPKGEVVVVVALGKSGGVLTKVLEEIWK